jgi:predicted transcriptional regulator
MTPGECREARLSLQATPEDLARRAGVVLQTVIRFEAGLAQARPVTLVALRRGLRLLKAERGG